MQGKQVCVFGSANVDHFVYVNHIPLPGETLQAERWKQANGGKGANQAVAAARLGMPTVFVGQVGDDGGHTNLQKEMSQAGVKLAWRHVPGMTGQAFIYVDRTGENSIVIVGGANMEHWDWHGLPASFEEEISRSDYLLLQKEIPTEVNILAAECARAKGKTVVLDCGGRDDPIPERLLQAVSILSPNTTELGRLIPDLNKDDLVKEVRSKLLARHAGLQVLLKLGSKGSMLITGEHAIGCGTVTELCPDIAKEYSIVDTVGAGDCFTAAYIVRHAELDWGDPTQFEAMQRRALLFGNGSAFLCITKEGAMPSLPSRKDVDHLLLKYLSERI